MITLLLAHPSARSFNHAILTAITDALTGLGRDYQVIDLYADGFNPVMSASELGSDHSDLSKEPDPLAERYVEMLQRTTQMVIIFPVWWGMMPAMLKGFFDRAFAYGRVYDIDAATGALLPCLSVNRTLIVTTTGGASTPDASFVSDTLIHGVLAPVGITGAEWLDCPDMDSADAHTRKAFIEDVVKKVI